MSPVKSVRLRLGMEFFVVEIKKDESHVGVTLLSNPRAGFQAPAELGRQDEARRIYKH